MFQNWNQSTYFFIFVRILITKNTWPGRIISTIDEFAQVASKLQQFITSQKKLDEFS